jgi:hypothetical protein
MMEKIQKLNKNFPTIYVNLSAEEAMKPHRRMFTFKLNFYNPKLVFRFLLLNAHNYKLIEKMHCGAEEKGKRLACTTMNANLNLVSYDNILLLLQTTLYRQVSQQICCASFDIHK